MKVSYNTKGLYNEEEFLIWQTHFIKQIVVLKEIPSEETQRFILEWIAKHAESLRVSWHHMTIELEDYL